ncbi:MAG TPA: neutral zinc metallopeptidase, partial [Demequina sp.]|nr:neutral zinc metallopeptidase [Demequina sp.]
PGVVVFDQATSTACGTASSATGPFYCPPDQTLYADTTFFSSLTQFGFEGGNLAEAYVIAHEYGHHVENELGIFDIADRSGTGTNSDSVKIELMADCLAGVWVGHAATTPDPDTGIPFLEPITQAQLDNALAAAASVGDDRIQETIQGEATPHTFTHGTSEQRTQAFTTGYTNGTVASCDAFGVLNR